MTHHLLFLFSTLVAIAWAIAIALNEVISVTKASEQFYFGINKPSHKELVNNFGWIR